MGFSRQEYWSGLPFPPSGALSDPRIEPMSIGSQVLYHWATREGFPVCLIPGSGRPPRGGEGILFQYSCLENSTGRGAWWATEHRPQSQTQLSTQTYRAIREWFWYVYLYLSIYIIFQISFHYRSLQNIEYSSLCYIVGWLVLVGYLSYIY